MQDLCRVFLTFLDFQIGLDSQYLFIQSINLMVAFQKVYILCAFYELIPTYALVQNVKELGTVTGSYIAP